MNETSIPELTSCQLCPRLCGANRLAGQRGYCGAGGKARVFHFGPHFGEEPPITGVNGSGTIFFSHCTLRCIYCQNHPWSQGVQGRDMTNAQLTAVFRTLANQGCHNWNLVSPTPWLPLIERAVSDPLCTGIAPPFVYNTSGFERVETLERYSHLIDVALVDLRYASAESAHEGSDAAGYVEAARNSLLWFWDWLGALRTNSEGVAQRGVICRLLVLPGRAQETISNLEWLAECVGVGIHLSVMSQYTPVHQASARAGWNRRITREEYARIVAAVESLGFDNGWIQDFEEEGDAELLGESIPEGEGAIGNKRCHVK